MSKAKLTQQQMKDLTLYIKHAIKAKLDDRCVEVLTNLTAPMLAQVAQAKADFKVKEADFIAAHQAAEQSAKIYNEKLRIFQHHNKKSSHYYRKDPSDIPKLHEFEEDYIHSTLGFGVRKATIETDKIETPTFITVDTKTAFQVGRSYDDDIKVHTLRINSDNIPSTFTPAEAQQIEQVVNDYNDEVDKSIKQTKELVFLASMGRTASEVQKILEKHGIKFKHVNAQGISDAAIEQANADLIHGILGIPDIDTK